MVILDPMSLSVNPLEEIEKVLQRQQPVIVGKSIEMEVYSSENHPKSLGDPWKGAYSRHGFWYKFHWGDEKDFKKLVAFGESQNEFLLQYEVFSMFIEELQGKVLVAKTLSGDLMGGITMGSHKEYTVIGCHFVLEEYRHSGIGEKLLREILEHIPPGHNVICNAVNPLHHSLARFGFTLSPSSPQIHRYIIENPDGLMKLEDVSKSQNSLLATDLNESQWGKLFEFYATQTKQGINEEFLRSFLTQTTTHCVVLFKEEMIMAMCALRRVAGGQSIGNLVVGPFISIDEKSAEQALRQTLNKYYNPDDDYDFDPDPEAIYRRSINFFVPQTNQSMPRILTKFRGDGKLKMNRLWYQTASFHRSIKAFSANIFSASDLNFFIV